MGGRKKKNQISATKMHNEARKTGDLNPEILAQFLVNFLCRFVAKRIRGIAGAS
jgi:hypothetical protein